MEAASGSPLTSHTSTFSGQPREKKEGFIPLESNLIIRKNCLDKRVHINTTDVYDRTVCELKKINIHVITHVILGLPYENLNDMISTVEHVIDAGTDGIKLQLLHVLKGTELEREYFCGKFKTLTLEKYLYILKKCLEVIPDNVVIHRLTGDGPKKLLVAPLWSADKKRVINAVRRITENRDEVSLNRN